MTTTKCCRQRRECAETRSVASKACLAKTDDYVSRGNELAELKELLAGGRPLSLQNEKKKSKPYDLDFGADYGARTRHLHLGKVALYQMS